MSSSLSLMVVPKLATDHAHITVKRKSRKSHGGKIPAEEEAIVEVE
jgi:hypothetical protein